MKHHRSIHRLITVVIATAIVALVATLVAQSHGAGVAQAETARATTATPVWHRDRVASYYKLWGNRTKCGRTSQQSSWFVAALKTENMRCGMKVTICHARRCVRVTVQDAGKHRYDRRDWDLTVRVKAALRCGDLCTVRWHKGHA